MATSAVSPVTITTLTPRGVGAVAVLAVRGDLNVIDQFFKAANGRSAATQLIGRICFGHWTSEPPEEVLLVRSSTDAAEIHCHGGIAAVSRIHRDLQSVGAHSVDWSESLKTTMPAWEAELTTALTRATTRRCAAAILRQFNIWRDQLKFLSNLNWEARQTWLADVLSWQEFARHLTDPWQVVLCGPPNVGKSSLINAIVGYARSVVYDQPGTTRDVVTVQTAIDGWPVELSDTAGIREGADELESAGIALARSRLESADLIIHVRDTTEPNDRIDLGTTSSILTIWNKVDSARPPEDQPSDFNVSATTGVGLPELIQLIAQRLVPRLPAEQQCLPVTAGLTEMIATLLDATHARDEVTFDRLRNEVAEGRD